MVEISASIYARLPFLQRIAVLGPAAPSVADLGFEEVRLNSPAPLQSASLRAGAENVGSSAKAVMVVLADMPLVSQQHLRRLRSAFNGTQPVCSAVKQQRCPPVLFPIAMLAALKSQHGDSGARSLLAQAHFIEASAAELSDVDDPSDLARVRALISD